MPASGVPANVLVSVFCIYSFASILFQHTSSTSLLTLATLLARCAAVPPRQEHDTVARVTSVQDNEQLYAVATILPFANLQELDLSGLQLNGEQWCALLEAISRCTGLRVLSIKGCNIGALGKCWCICLD